MVQVQGYRLTASWKTNNLNLCIGKSYNSTGARENTIDNSKYPGRHKDLTKIKLAYINEM